MKYYIVQKRNSEYNDEVTTFSDGGEPEKVFTTPEAAQKFCNEQNFKSAKGMNILEYGYAFDEVVKNCYKFINQFNQTFKTDHTEESISDTYEFELPKNMTAQQFSEIAPYLKCLPFEVCECQGE